MRGRFSLQNAWSGLWKVVEGVGTRWWLLLKAIRVGLEILVAQQFEALLAGSLRGTELGASRGELLGAATCFRHGR